MQAGVAAADSRRVQVDREDHLAELPLHLGVQYSVHADDVRLNGAVEQRVEVGVQPLGQKWHERAAKVERRDGVGERERRAEDQ